MPTDVRDPEAVDALVAATVEEFGRVDVLVNNAAGNFVVKAEELSPNGWRAVVAIVLDGGLPLLARGRKADDRPGRRRRDPERDRELCVDGAARERFIRPPKAGFVAMTRTLAVEWAPHGIRANCICPGPTDTEGAARRLAHGGGPGRVASTVPLGRLATPHEVAVWAAALCSPYAGYITGETLTIDGGHWLEQESYMPLLAELALEVRLDAALEEAAGDDEALDLARAFPDAVDPHLAVEARHRVLEHVAAAAEHLEARSTMRPAASEA